GNPAMRGLGLAKEATQLWIDYGVSALGIKKIQISTLNTNIHNVRLNEDLGFKVEGILRNEICVDGVYLDVLRMGLWTE
ncbi:MAG: GNAT family N-acetyltransferase, partial [Proteobacteria bacterium]|nr:GNAT family N-acetyltransferase [Pseudomonadota bacterium]